MKTQPISRSVLRVLPLFAVVAGAGALLVANLTPHAESAPKPSDKSKAAATKVSFYKQIRPIFQANCHGCHQPAKANGEYVMTSFKKLLAGGESGDAAVTPGKPDKSYLIELITPEKGEAEMPKGKQPLSQDDIALLKTWITQGAVDDTPADARVQYDMKHPPAYSMPPVITSLDFSPDGKLLAVAGFHEVLLHKADGSGLVARLVGMSERIESVRFSPDGKRLAVTGGLPGRMGEVQVWDVAKRELTLSTPVTYDTLYGASWSPNGKLIAFGCADNTVRAIDAKTGKQVLYQGSHNGWVLDTVFSVEGSHVISVGNDRTAKLTELGTQRFIDNITSITPGALKGGIEAVARHPKADAILVGGADGVPKIYRVFRQTKRVIGDDANLIRRFPQMKGRIFGVAFSRDGKRIAAVSGVDNSAQLRVYGFDFELKLPKKLAIAAAKRPVQRSEEEKRKLASYQVKGVKTISEFAVPDSGLYAVAMNATGSVVAVAGFDGRVRLIDAGSGKLIKSLLPVPITPKVMMETAKRELLARPEPEFEKESLHKDDSLVAVTILPATVKLTGKYDSVQVLVTGKTQTGAFVDLTRMVKVSGAAGVVEVSPRGRMRPLKNGRADLTFSINGKTVRAKVEVTGQTAKFKPLFVRDVGPVLSRMGCNTGTCHGANKGKGGFKLSLRGNDAVFDVRVYTDDHKSRRANVASPDNSLMLLKASAEVPHIGGQTTRPGEPYYEIVRKWIADGARLESSSPRVTRIEIFPKNPIVQRVGTRQQFRILATYTDGEVRDVTAESHIEQGANDIANADEAGLVTALRRGESPILARFEGRYAATTMTVMGDRSGFVWKQPPANNFIDELVAAKLERTKTLPSGLCTDAEFVRRIWLDLTGLPPTAADLEKFLADKRPTRVKRDELIDRLIGSEAFVEHWTNKWADLLQVNRKYLGAEGAKSFRQWIRKEVAANTPYDKFTYKILTASGSNKKNPPASYYKIHRTPQDTMENTTHLFLGVRFSCNKCHDHPFEKWAQTQYFETAAYFAQVGLKRDPVSGKRQIGRTAVEKGKPLYEIIYDKKTGDVKHDRTGQITPPKFPFEAKYDVPKNGTRREHLARWITSKDNRYFAKSYVNRLWAYLTGVGFIEPIDDIRAGNPPTNPELLDRLTAKFLKGGFDARELMRMICKSRTYQLSVASNTWNADDGINYSHAVARRLPAEVLYDTLHRVTGSISKIAGVPPGTRAAQLPDAGVKLPSGFLTKFGRPARESACECERSSGMQLGPVMSLVSGPTVANAITDPKNEITKLAASKITDEQLVERLFLRILNRPATKREVQAGVAAIRDLPAEHRKLIAELTAYRKKLAPAIVAKEKRRKAAIVKAGSQLKAYEQKIAAREAKLDAKRKQQTARRQAELKKYETTLPAKLKAWEARQSRATQWVALDPAKLSSTSAIKLVKQKDKSVLARGANRRGAYTFIANTNLVGITGVKLEVLIDASLPKKGPGRAPDGNLVLSEFELFVAPKSDPKKSVKVKLENAQADFSQRGYNVKTAIDGKVAPAGNGWAISPQVGKPHLATFEVAGNTGHKGGTVLTFVLKQQFQSGKHSIGRFRISVTTSPKPILLKGLPQPIAAILKVPAAKRNAKQKTRLMAYYRRIDSRLKTLNKALADSRKPRPVDPQLKRLRDGLATANKPLPIDPALADLQRAAELSKQQLKTPRLTAAQDIAWALINSPSFLFNR